jgi:hypothetical protein
MPPDDKKIHGIQCHLMTKRLYGIQCHLMTKKYMVFCNFMSSGGIECHAILCHQVALNAMQFLCHQVALNDM